MKPAPLTKAVFILTILAAAGDAWAASQSISALVWFDTVLQLTKNSDLSFGSLKAGQTGTYTLSPAGNLAAADGGIWLGGGAQPASLTIAGSTTQAISIAASNYVANNGVMPSLATCSYDGGSPMPCVMASAAAPGTGKELKLGLTIVVDGSQGVGSSAAPSFDVIVNYN